MTSGNDIYLLKFMYECDCNKVVSRGHWTLGKVHFMLKRWEAEDNLTSKEPKNMRIWVKFFDIPGEVLDNRGF